MAYVSDNFVRANGALGGSWGTPYSLGQGSAVINVLNNGFAASGGSGGTNGSISVWQNGTFDNDQYCQVSISALTSYTSQFTISACSSSAGTSTYTYSLTAGAALVVGQQVYISGMTNSGNNSTAGFIITGLGAGTFSVANASPGANESGSTGLGKSPRDCGGGPCVRMSSDGSNGYFTYFGPNSGKFANQPNPSVDQRLYCHEIWKVVNGVQTFLVGGTPPSTASAEQVNDVFRLTAIGNVLTLYQNGVEVVTATDSTFSSGNPGINTWGCGSPGNWLNTPSYAVGDTTCQFTNMQSAGILMGPNGQLPIASDNFTRANGGLGANWTTVTSTNAPAIASNKAVGTVLDNRNAAFWNANAFNNDQYSSIVLGNTPITADFQMAIVRCASAALTYYLGYTSAGSTLGLLKIVAGSQSALTTYTVGASTVSTTNTVGDVLTITAVGTTISLYQNGILKIQATDASISSGAPGFVVQADGTEANASLSQWAGGNMANSFSISGSAGVAGATVSYTGQSSGSVVADGSGNYSIPSLANGSYTITPSLTGYTFSPASSSQTVSGTNITGVNFRFIQTLPNGVWTKQGTVIVPNTTDINGGAAFSGTSNPDVHYEANPQLISANGDGKVFKMWFQGTNNIYYAESNDGLNWTRYAPALVTGYGFPRVYHDGSTYYMYCQISPNGPTTSALYTCTDGTGINFSLVNSNVLAVGGTWDSSSIYYMGIFAKIGGLFYASYTGNSGSSLYGTGLATSPDGVAWTKTGEILANFAGAQILKIGSAWYAFAQVTANWVQASPNNLDPSDIGMSRSQDLVTWTNVPLILNRSNVMDGLNQRYGEIAPPAILEVNGATYIYYTGTNTGGLTGVGYLLQAATSSKTLLQIVNAS